MTINNIEIYNNKGMEHFPIKDNSCHAVFMLAVLEHLDNPLEMLKEAYRILVIGGSLVLTTPTRLARPILEFMAYRLHIIDEEGIREHKHYYSKDEIFILLNKTGFANFEYNKFCFGMNSFVLAKK